MPLLNADALPPVASNRIFVPSSSGAIDICKSYVNACNKWLDNVACPAPMRTTSTVASLCGNTTDLTTWNPGCACGSVLDFGDRFRELFVDRMVNMRLSSFSAPNSLLVAHGRKKTDLFGMEYPVIDVCASFEKACISVMALMGCPQSSQTIVPCSGEKDYASSLSNFGIVQCMCGGFDAGARVAELVFFGAQPALLGSYVAPAVNPVLVPCTGASCRGASHRFGTN